ncbi:hypothetical protein AB0I77_32425 [Streptomyces sp. NPDC050619]|uniref:hypothetical protein n=1 Tax=Streptomyces sp. NPDC050619 TaxID=3157214 RepID=UPI00341FC80A
MVPWLRPGLISRRCQIIILAGRQRDSVGNGVERVGAEGDLAEQPEVYVFAAVPAECRLPLFDLWRS